DRARRAEEAGVAVAEDAAVGGREPVAPRPRAGGLGERRAGPRAGAAGVLAEHRPAEVPEPGVVGGRDVVAGDDARVARALAGYDDAHGAVALEIGDQRRVLHGHLAHLDAEEVLARLPVEGEGARRGGDEKVLSAVAVEVGGDDL